MNTTFGAIYNIAAFLVAMPLVILMFLSFLEWLLKNWNDIFGGIQIVDNHSTYAPKLTSSELSLKQLEREARELTKKEVVREGINPNNYTIYRDVPSKYIKGKIYVNQFLGWACPRCDSEGRETIMVNRPGEYRLVLSLECPSCHLKMDAASCEEDGLGGFKYERACIYESPTVG